MTLRLAAATLLVAVAAGSPAHAAPPAAPACPAPTADPVGWATYCVVNPWVEQEGCLLTTTLAPTQVKDVVVFHPNGDVDVNGEPFWDCPPYQS